MEIPNDMASFAELQEFVYRTYHKHIIEDNFISGNPFWTAIQEDPIGKRTINNLKGKGWKINFGDKFPKSIREFLGLCLKEEKEIWILKRLECYERDKAICHEIVHAVYGEIADDDPRFYDKHDRITMKCRRNNALTEWYARQIRATPTLLSSIWKNFDISPKIYDLVSLMALDFEITRNPQRIFPSFYKDYNFTLMD